MSTDQSTEQDAAADAEYFSSGSGTHVGMRREENQDSHLIVREERFDAFIVADGMGGAQGGAVASQLSLEVFAEHLKAQDGVSCEKIVEGIQKANKRIFEEGNGDPALMGMGTTFVGLCCVREAMFLFNVGDSRVYRIRRGRIELLTEDHTLVSDLIRSGALTPEQAENHPVSHMLTRSLGPAETLEPDCWLCEDGPAQGDRYIICSDGLYNMVSEGDLLGICGTGDLNEACDRAVQLANENGGTDNITIVLVEVSENFPVGPEKFAAEESQGDTVELEIDSRGVVSDSDREKVVSANGSGNDPLMEDDESGSPRLTEHVDIGEVHDQLTEEQIESDVDAGGAEDAEQEAAQPEETESAPEEDEAEEESEEVDGSAEASSDEAEVMSAEQAEEETDSELEEEEISDEELSRMKTEALERPRSRRLGIKIIGVSIGIVLIFLLTLSNKANGPTIATNSQSTSVEQGPVDPEAVDPPVEDTQLAVEVPEDGVGTGEAETGELLDPNAEVFYQGLTRKQAMDVLARKERVSRKIEKTEERLQSIFAPLSGAIGEMHRKGSRELEMLEAEFEEMRSEIEAATRRMNVWFGRRKRLQNTDHVNLAAEVAISSQEVREAKQAFETATWNYLKEAENWRYEPDNKELKAKVDELTRLRKLRMEELHSAVVTAIESEAERSHEEVTELFARRDTIESEISELKSELEYAGVLMSGDSSVKRLYERRLKAELESAKKEAAELEKLLPDAEAKRLLDDDSAGVDESEASPPALEQADLPVT